MQLPLPMMATVVASSATVEPRTQLARILLILSIFSYVYGFLIYGLSLNFGLLKQFCANPKSCRDNGHYQHKA